MNIKDKGKYSNTLNNMSMDDSHCKKYNEGNEHNKIILQALDERINSIIDDYIKKWREKE